MMLPSTKQSENNLWRTRFYSIPGYFIICFLLFDCQIDEPFDYSSSKDFIVVNSLLSPDSIISITITHAGTAPISSAQFEVVEEADVDIFEDDNYLGSAEYNPGFKKYIFDYYPKPGKAYSIAVNVQDNPVISAQTSIPIAPEAAGCYARDTLESNGNCGFITANMHIRNLLPGSKLWITCYSDDFKYVRTEDYTISIDSSQIERNSFWYLSSKSHLLDQFNAMQDLGSTSYQVYMRLESDTETPKIITIDASAGGQNHFYDYCRIKDLDERQGLYMVAIVSSEEFDRYLKGIIINNFNDEELVDGFPNPFAERVDVYTNIENGLGIFAGYNTVTIPLHENECE